MKIKSKRPSISKDIIKSNVDGNYILYNISTDTGYLEDLTLTDIIFIRNNLTKFINQVKGGMR